MDERAELYPCGARVRIPSLGVKSSGSLLLIGTRSNSDSSMDVVNQPVQSKRTDITDILSMKLNFSDDIIETVCPETVTYKKAREDVRRILRSEIAADAQTRRKEMRGRSKSLVQQKAVKDLRGCFKNNLHNKLIASSVDSPAFVPVLQSVFPKPLSEWTRTDPSKTTPTGAAKPGKVSRGSRRWTSLPVRVPTPNELQLTLKSLDDDDDDGGPDKAVETTLSNVHKDEGPADVKLKRLLNVFAHVMSTWKVFVQPSDVHSSSVMKYLSSSSASKQLYGLALACQVYIKDSLLVIDSVSYSSAVLRQLKVLLEAETERVRVAAAILLCCSCETDNTQQVTQTLLSAISSSSYSERWSAARTLAITGTCNTRVVTILFDHVSDSKSTSEKEKASQLLSELSKQSKLVVSLLAEKLNSSCWKERRTSCTLIPLLQHPLNKDISDRLLHCALHDWNSQVRSSASRALGKTDKGKLIHDSIKQDLTDANETTRLNALKRIHLLHIMTATILPVFLKCFKDQYNSIKLEAISIAEDFQLMDDGVISALTHLLQDDCWKIKAHAIKAVGSLKITSEGVISHLLWAARFEQLPEVRAQVCHTLATLATNKDDERIVTALKDLLNVEDNKLVLSEARKSLEILGHDTCAMDTMADIVCAEVKSLGTKERITEQIISSEKNNFIDSVIGKQ